MSIVEQFVKKLTRKRKLATHQARSINDKITLGIALRSDYYYYTPDLGIYLFSEWSNNANYIKIVKLKNK